MKYLLQNYGNEYVILNEVREWAIEKLTAGHEPPWSWYQHMKLREALDAILQGMAVTRPLEDLPEPAPRRGGGLRLVGATYQQDSVPHHQADEPVLLPM